MKAFFTLLCVAAVWASAPAATTITTTNRYSYGADVGWMDWYADGVNGALIGQYFCAGYVYGANVGWISLGSGAPANQIYYQNNSASDFGVNQDGLGNLRGFAYGANIGWLNFESQGAPTIDLQTGRLTGYVWSANCGWLSLSNAFTYVKTSTLWPGLLDCSVSPTLCLPVAWEVMNFGHTGVDPNADPDGDGMSNYQEYVAGTNPNLASDLLKITAVSVTAGPAPTVTLIWKSTPTRVYSILKTTSFQPSGWVDSGLGRFSPDPGASTTRTFPDTTGHFYRIEAFIPSDP
jgi:hypothetical protein